MTIDDKKDDHWEIRFGIAISFLASILAINELGAGKFGEDELQTGNEKTKAYMWYQSKSIKETTVKGQLDLINTFIAQDAIAPAQRESLASLTEKLTLEVQRYKQEKDEILRGSRVVGEENWAQELDGKLGQIVGATELEELQSNLAKAGDTFDLAALFLQICLVLGAVGLVVRQPKRRAIFFGGMLVLGSIGGILCAIAYSRALAT